MPITMTKGPGDGETSSQEEDHASAVVKLQGIYIGYIYIGIYMHVHTATKLHTIDRSCRHSRTAEEAGYSAEGVLAKEPE